MNRLSPIFLLLAAASIFCSCSDDELYPAPIIVSPVNGTTYYPDQRIDIKWTVPDSTKTVEMQMLVSNDSLFFEKGIILFDTLTTRTSFTNKTSYKFYFDANLSEKLYYGFRLRQKTSHGSSAWTSVHFFNVFPYSSLIIKYITVKSNFQFIAQESNEYYSGLITSENYIDLDKELITNGYSTTNLQFIKPESGFISDKSNFANHIERVVFGIGNVQEGEFPFDVWGDAYGISNGPRITFYPNGGVYRNVYKEIGGKNLQMRAAYFLSTFFEKKDQIGIQHELLIEINLKCYYR